MERTRPQKVYAWGGIPLLGDCFHYGFKRSIERFLRYGIHFFEEYGDNCKLRESGFTDASPDAKIKIDEYEFKTTIDDVLQRNKKSNPKAGLTLLLDSVKKPRQYGFSIGHPENLVLIAEDRAVLCFSGSYDSFPWPEFEIYIQGLGETPEEAARNHEELKAKLKQFKKK